MPRPVRARGPRVTLHPDVLHFLETGEHPALSTRRDPAREEARFLCWLIQTDQLDGRGVWPANREAILSDWQAAGKPGKPWAETHLGA